MHCKFTQYATTQFHEILLSGFRGVVQTNYFGNIFFILVKFLSSKEAELPEKKLNQNTPVSSYERVTFLCRCSSVIEARMVFVYVNGGTCCIRCKLKSSLFIFMNAYQSLIDFNFDYLHKITSLYGNLSYNIFISCHFKIQLIFKTTKFHKRNQYLQSWVCLP